MAFPFLDLPPEIREKIYLSLCTSPDYISLSDLGACRHPFFPLSLLLTCHQLYHEVRPLYFAHNAFDLFLSHTLRLSYFLSPSFRDNCLQIKSLRLTIMRWGLKNFFVGTFVPHIIDMILNGNLRYLDVRVRKDHFVVFDVAQGEMVFREGEAVEKLRMILEDPYLVRVVVNTYERVPIYPQYTLGIHELSDVTGMLDRSASLVRR